jgi:hypothetical protein
MEFPRSPANYGGGRTISLARGGKSGLVDPAGVTEGTPRRGPMLHSTDAEIRAAFHRKALRSFHRCNDTLVIDELGLAHAKARIDVAVINGSLHGFEIKSAADTLTRLPQQLELYEQCLEKLTIVCAEKHIQGVRDLVPRWCGIMKVSKGPRGGIVFITMREPKRNPNIQPYRLAHLLWRSEAVAILTQANASPKVLRAPRKTLYKSLAAKFSVAEITAFIKQSMALRQDWRPHQSPA